MSKRSRDNKLRTFNEPWIWTYSTIRHWGETPQGKWKVIFADDGKLRNTQLDTLQMTFYGTNGIPYDMLQSPSALPSGSLSLSHVSPSVVNASGPASLQLPSHSAHDASAIYNTTAIAAPAIDADYNNGGERQTPRKSGVFTEVPESTQEHYHEEIQEIMLKNVIEFVTIAVVDIVVMLLAVVIIVKYRLRIITMLGCKRDEESVMKGFSKMDHMQKSDDPTLEITSQEADRSMQRNPEMVECVSDDSSDDEATEESNFRVYY